MKQRHPAALALAAILLTTCLAFVVPVSADDWTGWGSWGFSGTAIANDDPVNPTSRLIGGAVTTVHADRRMGAGQNYTYTAKIILDTEGVALRTRVHWTNSEAGFREVVDMKTGIAVYPMDESIDVAVAVSGGVRRYSFPTPAGYDIMAANTFAIRDSGEAVFVTVCEQTIAVLKLEGARTEGGRTYMEQVTVMNGDGYVYGRIHDARVLADSFYIAYSSENARALIEVTEQTLTTDAVADTLPTEQETSADWVPETAPMVTEPPSEPVTEVPTEPVTETTDEQTEPVTTPEPEVPTTPAVTDTETSGGCGAAVVGSAASALSAVAVAATAMVALRKKHE